MLRNWLKIPLAFPPLLCALSFFVFSSPRVWAKEDRIRLMDLIEEAKRENPEIKRAESVLRAALAVPKQVSTLPNPELMLGLTNVGSKYSVGNESMSMLEIGISQPFPYPKKLSLLGKAATKDAQAASEAYRNTLYGVISRLKVSYFDYWLEEETRRILTEMLEVFEALQSTALSLYEVGSAIQQDAILADIEIDRVKERLELLEPERARLQADINAILNRPPTEDLGIPESSLLSMFTPSLKTLLDTARERSPRVLESRRIREGEGVRLNYAKTAYIPDFRLTAGYGDREGLTPQWSVGLGIELPIYFWRKEVYGVKEATARLIASQMAHQDTLQGTLAKVRALHAQALSDERLAELYAKRILPKARAALKSSLASYGVGNIDFLSVLTNATTLLEYEIAYATKVSEVKKALAQIEGLIGMTLEENNNPTRSSEYATHPKERAVSIHP